jgi:hypothetical protein
MKEFLLSMDLLSGGHVVGTASHRGHGAVSSSNQADAYETVKCMQ